jgi:phenylalanyl-tRNA synthetase beta chain
VASHPKGIQYGSIISSFDKWPILIDGKDQILSLPPIINSNNLGRITSKTENILVEVTGTNEETVHNTLKIFALAMTVRGGSVYSCTEAYGYDKPARRVVSPNLTWTSMQLDLQYVNRLLGSSLTRKEIKRYLANAGYNVRGINGKTVRLEIPPYRIDIMHSVDVIEDIAIAMDVNKMKPEWPKIWTIGSLSQETVRTRPVEELMIGLGYQQVLTYVLTSPTVVNENMNTRDSLVELLNPTLVTHNALRSWLLPSLLEFLSHNTHVDYPQKIFEAGKCIVRNNGSVRESRKLAAVTVHSNAGFTEIRSVFDALALNMGQEFKFEATEHPSFLTGRCAKISSNSEMVGVIGEISPIVLRKWGLALPIAAFELDLSPLLDLDQFAWTSAKD